MSSNQTTRRQPKALLITSVQAGSPAAAAKVLVGDLLLSIDGKAPEVRESCSRGVDLSDSLTGNEAAVGFLSGGKIVERKIKPVRTEF